ncbi:hypothetical protein DTO96_101409 [Ephemeroptericola cinctiostellae]|uniref:AAA domain-containing protein n=2 Tax=Ephemeroptericola cinctiostellae TaxID=2268024 RepID=A0A345DBE0_9BURK|nr:hypothetical protein DTO96_101409 [Ephemeroptericola cinctiostellae]
MAIYAIWNNKGGVGKSYLTFQIAAEYALKNPNKKVLVVDLCPQANSSTMLLGGMENGESVLETIHSNIEKRKTISGYIDERIVSPYISPKTGANYLTQVQNYNTEIPSNLYLLVGDEQLENQASKIYGASINGPDDAWRIVHLWIKDLINDVQNYWGEGNAVFIDCNPSFTIYTELALMASDRLLIPFSADGSSKRAVKAVLSLLYGITRYSGERQSDFFLESEKYKMALPQIYMYIGNRLTQMNNSSASAFKTVVNTIGDEIYAVWQRHAKYFATHPSGAVTPSSKKTFKQMFQFEVNDANTASVVSSAKGIPIANLSHGFHSVAGKKIMVNQTQLDKQIPNVQELVTSIE